MKIWLLILCACSLMSGCASNDHSASTGDSAAKTSAAAQVAGNYAGNWTATDGATGKVRVSLKKPDGGPWEAKVSFTYDGDEASTMMKSVEVSGDHVRVSYDYEIQDNKGSVEMKGDLAGDTLQGTYTVTTGGNPGTWTANRMP